MAPRTGGATVPGLGTPQAPPSERPERYPLPLGGTVGVALGGTGFALVFLGMAAGPGLLASQTVLPLLNAVVHAIGYALVSGIGWGLRLLVVGVAAYAVAGWLRPRYPGRLDFKNDLNVRLHDELGAILHPGDCAIRVRRKHGVYRVLVRLRGNGLQYEDKRLAVVRAVTGMGFYPPEVSPYQGFRTYDLEAIVTAQLPALWYLWSLRYAPSRLISRVRWAVKDLRDRRGHGRR